MADEYQTEQEQLEALKKWWQENGASTLIAVGLTVAGVFGWQTWQKHQQTQIEAASASFQNLLLTVEGGSDQLSDEQLATANHLADTLKNDFSSSSYAGFAALYKAKFAVEQDDLDSAASELRWVIAEGDNEMLTTVAKLRLAKVLYAQQQYDQALAELEGEAGGYEAAYEEMRGDVLAAMGQSEQAIAAYRQAQTITSEAQQPLSSGLVELKLQQLTSSTAAAETDSADATDAVDVADQDVDQQATEEGAQ